MDDFHDTPRILDAIQLFTGLLAMICIWQSPVSPRDRDPPNEQNRRNVRADPSRTATPTSNAGVRAFVGNRQRTPTGLGALPIRVRVPTGATAYS
jgi:hypothetical protein